MIDVFVFSILTAIFWGTSPIFVKKGMAHGGSSTQAAVMAVGVSTGLYWGILTLQGNLLGFLTELSLRTVGLFIVGGLVGTAVGRLLYYFSVDRVGASIANAGTNTRPLFASLMGIVILKEMANMWTIVGTLILIAGLIMLSLSKGGDIRGWSKWDLVFPVSAAIAFAIGNIARSAGLHGGVSVIEGITINESTALFVLLVYAFGWRKDNPFRASRTSYMYFLVSSLLSATGLLLLFESLSRGPVTIVDPLVGTQTLFATLLSFFFLKELEQVSKGVIVGASFVVLGVVFITL